jgi:enoyl-CoA hydratase
MTEPLVVEIDAAVVTLTLSRPAQRNALDLRLVEALEAALARYAADPGLRCAVITGAPPAFCAGLDLKAFAAPDSPRERVTACINSLSRLAKPLIAAVNGPAMTGGLEVALACDFIIAGESARFGDTHTKIGALSGSGMGSRLPHAVGARFAKQMILTGEPIDAATALRVGLVNEVTSDDELLSRSRSVAKGIAAYDPELVALAKGVVDQGAATTLAEAGEIERRTLAERKRSHAMAWSRPAKAP